MTTSSENDRGILLVDSVIDVISMKPEIKQLLTDQISKKQPFLMNEITSGLSNLGVSQDRIDNVIEILLILYEYYSDRWKIELPVVTDKIINETRANFIAFLEWQRREDSDDYDRLFKKAIESHPDTLALGFLISHINMYGFSDKSTEGNYCIMTSRIVLDSLVRVKKEISIDFRN